MRQSNLATMMVQVLLLLNSIALAAPFVTIPSNTPSIDKRQSSSYWLANIERKGKAAYNPTPDSYKVFRNVREYGALGDGVSDDTEAIQSAITDGDRCGNAECDSSTIYPAIVYFPPGTYKISKAVIMYYYTQLIGDAIDVPTIKGAENFDPESIAMLDADPYIPQGNGDNWYTNQNNFYRQLRNLIIDMTSMPKSSPSKPTVNGVHWQVAQACSMQNVHFKMVPPDADNRQVGIWMDNGSGMFMSDITFEGGDTGAFLGSQQFATRNLTFRDCNQAIQVNWNWLWTFKSLDIDRCITGLNISRTNETHETTGSAILMDSRISVKGAGVVTSYGPDTFPVAGSTFYIHNVDFKGTEVAVADTNGDVLLAGGTTVEAWGQGNAYVQASSPQVVKRSPQEDAGSGQIEDNAPPPPCTGPPMPISTVSIFVTVSPTPATETSFGTGISVGPLSTTNTSAPYPTASNATAGSTPIQCSASAVIPSMSKVMQRAMEPPAMPEVLLNANGAVFERSKPQYINESVDTFISIKTFGAIGDGKTDDTVAIQKAMAEIQPDKILYFDHGAYVITDTIDVPSKIRMTGEIWPLIMISDEKGTWSDIKEPKAAFRVGHDHDTGVVEISDLIFETKGPAPGAVMMEWNVKEAYQGSVGMWDTHFRVGGSAGTELQLAQCDSTARKTFSPECAASFLMMHVTQDASAYFENTWFWVADHDLDLPRQNPRAQANQTSIFNGRGVFIESHGPTWLWGTSSEHSQLYNYQFANAKNVFMASVQTETAYMQSAPNALNGGFPPNPAWSDPDFADCTSDQCKKTWGMRILDSSHLYMFGGGMYSFFDDYKQECLETEDCQSNMIDIQCSSDVYLYGVTTRGTTNQVVVNGQAAVLEKDNPNDFGSTFLLYHQQ